MEIVVGADVPIKEKSFGTQIRPGNTRRQALLAANAPDGLSFAVNRTEWLGGDETNTTPRHNHPFQQIRWAETGRVNLAPGQDIGPGDIAYVPRAAWYGPQLRDQGISVTLQFGFNGEKQHGTPYWDGFQDEAMKRLRARGVFEGGYYYEIEPETKERRRFDGVDALYQEQYLLATGRPFVVAPEAYSEAILMHIDAFDYDKSVQGVAIKRLGCFYDHPGPNGDIRLNQLRLFDGGSYELGAERAQIGWTLSDGLEVNGTLYPVQTYFYIPRDEVATFGSSTAAELLLFEMPRLD